MARIFFLNIELCQVIRNTVDKLANAVTSPSTEHGPFQPNTGQILRRKVRTQQRGSVGFPSDRLRSVPAPVTGAL